MTQPELLFTDVEVEGHATDVRVVDGVVDEIGHGLRPLGLDTEVVAGGGGALIPGLPDHHVHLLEMAAAADSIDLAVDTPHWVDRLRATSARNGAWIRLIGHHESRDGVLDRDGLDRLRADVPVKVQHRGGGLWILNSAALDLIPDHPGSEADHGVERDASGRRTGRLWRRDDLVRAASSGSLPSLRDQQAFLRSVGVTGVTDASPDLDHRAIRHLLQELDNGPHHLRLTLMAAAAGADSPGAHVGPVKIALHDHDLPTPEGIAERIQLARGLGRAAAVHCVTRASLVLTLAAFEAMGTVDGDRIEHATVAPPELRSWLSRLGLRVVAQPSLLLLRGDDYLAEVEAHDLPDLIPYAALLAADVRVAPSSDAPYGSPDPWMAMAAARDRLSRSGVRVGTDAGLDPRRILDGYLSASHDPGGRARKVLVGAPADVCLLHVGLEQALAECSVANVRATYVDGQ